MPCNYTPTSEDWALLNSLADRIRAHLKDDQYTRRAWLYKELADYCQAAADANKFFAQLDSEYR